MLHLPRVLAAAVVGSTLSLAIGASSASAQTYPLVCKGTNLGVVSTAGSVRISFDRYPQGVGPHWNALTPGSCAWIDRAVGPAEPNVVCYNGNGPFDISWTTRPTTHVEQVWNNGAGCMVVA